jgi:hypothetical protein
MTPLLKRRYRGQRAPVAQWIEQRFPKPRAQVRLLPGVFRAFWLSQTRMVAWVRCAGSAPNERPVQTSVQTSLECPFRAERFRALEQCGIGSTMRFVPVVRAAKSRPRVVSVWSGSAADTCGRERCVYCAFRGEDCSAALRLVHPTLSTAYNRHSSSTPSSSAKPRSRNRRPDPATRSFTVLEQRTSPGCARLATLAPMCTATPPTLLLLRTLPYADPHGSRSPVAEHFP